MGQKIQQHLTDTITCPTCGARSGSACMIPTIKHKRDGNGQPATQTVNWLHHARKAA